MRQVMMAAALDSRQQERLDNAPLGVFRFHVSFRPQPLRGAAGSELPLCQGAFAECTAKKHV